MRIRCLLSLLILIIPMIFYPIYTPDKPQYGGRANHIVSYSQKNSDWKALELNGHCLPPCNTIGTCGCALTSVAMVFTSFGAYSRPDRLNECLGSIACPLDFERAAERCGKDWVDWGGRYSFSWWRLNQLAKMGKLPVILGMTNKWNEKMTHFVVVTSGKGYSADGYKINDPEYLNGRNVSLTTRIKNWDLKWLIVYKRVD